MKKNNVRKCFLFVVICVLVLPYIVKADVDIDLGVLGPGEIREQSISNNQNFTKFTCEKISNGPYSVATEGAPSSGRIVVKVDYDIEKKYPYMKFKCTFDNNKGSDIVHNYTFDITNETKVSPVKDSVTYHMSPGNSVNLWSNLNIKSVIGYTFTENGDTGVYTVNGCTNGSTSCKVSFSGSSSTNDRITRLELDYVKRTGLIYKTTVYLVEYVPRTNAKAYPGLMGFCDFNSDWQYAQFIDTGGERYSFYEAISKEAKLPDCSKNTQNGKLYTFKGWSTGYEEGKDTLQTATICQSQNLVSVGTIAKTGEIYAPCYELVPHVRLVTNGGIVKQDSTWSFNPDDMTYISIGESLNDTVVLPEVEYSGYHSSSTLSYWKNNSTGEVKYAGEAIKLDGSVWAAVSDNVTTRVDLYKTVGVGSTEVFSVDGMTSCLVDGGISQHLDVKYKNGDCIVEGLIATGFEQFVDVKVGMTDGSTRIYKFTVEDRTGMGQNGNGIFVVDTSQNVVVGENDATLANNIYTDQCNTFKVFSDNYSKSRIEFAKSALDKSTVIYSGAYDVEADCGLEDQNEYIAFCLDPGRRGPSQEKKNAEKYIKVSDVNAKTDFGKMVAYIVGNMRVEEFGSYINDTSKTIDQIDIDRVAAHVALRISAIKNGLSTAADSADLVYASLYYPYEAVAKKLAELDDDGDITLDEANKALEAGFDFSGYDDRFHSAIRDILYKYDGSDGAAGKDGFERTIDETKVASLAPNYPNGYLITYKGTVTVPSGASKVTLDKCNSDYARAAGIECSVHTWEDSGKEADGGRSIYNYEITIKATDASKVKVPGNSADEKALAFKISYTGNALVESAFIANPIDGSKSLQRMLILTTTTPDIYIYFNVVPRDCDMPFLNKDNCLNESECKSNKFNSDLFVSAGCCRYVLDNNKYNYILSNFCEPTCTNSTLSSACPYTANGAGKADVYTIKEGEKLVSGSDWQPNVGACVANVNNYYVNDSANSVENITNGDKFIYTDDANNLMNVEAYKNNRYCQVTCKEDWEISMDSFGNFIGGNAVAAGTYFQNVSNDIFISGTRTCYTSFINYDRFMNNITELSKQLVSKYNLYSEWSHVWTDIDNQTDAEVSIKTDPISPVCVEYHDSCPDGYFWHDVLKGCKQVPKNIKCANTDSITEYRGTHGVYKDLNFSYTNGGANNKDTKCKFDRYYCDGSGLSNVYDVEISGDLCTYYIWENSSMGGIIQDFDNDIDACKAAGGIWSGSRGCDTPKCKAGYRFDNNKCYGVVTRNAILALDPLEVDVDYNDEDLECKVYGKGYNYTLKTTNDYAGKDPKYSTSMEGGYASSMSVVVGEDIDYSKTYTHSCTITPAEKAPRAKGSSSCKQTGLPGGYTKTNYMFCEEYANLSGTDLDNAFCKADGKEDSSSYDNKTAAFDYMKRYMLEQAKKEASSARSSMMSYHSSIYAHAYDIFDCQHFQLHNNTDDMDTNKANNAIATDKIMGSTRSYVKILTEFDPTASYTYDEERFMTILGKDNILEQYTEKNDAAYGDENEYAKASNDAKEVTINLSDGSRYETYLYRNYIQNYYYNSGPWGIDTPAYKKYDDGNPITSIENVSESSKKIVMCTVYGAGSTGTSGVAFANSGSDPEWYGGRCYPVTVDYKEVHYVKSSISNSSYYKNKGRWYVSGSDLKEHGDNLRDALNNANNRSKNRTNYNIEEEIGHWSKLGEFNVFPISMDTPRNLYKYTYTFGQIGSYSDGKLGRIMGTTKSIIKDNTRSCFYEVFEEVCLCCGYKIPPGDFVEEYISTNSSEFDYSLSDPDAIKENTGGSLSFYTNSVSLGNLELGRGKDGMAANWSVDQAFMYNGNSSLITDKGAQLKRLIEDKGENIYADKPEYAYYLTPDVLREIRYYNDAVGYELNYNNLKLYGANTIACSENDCNDSAYDSNDEPKILFQHYGSKFLAGEVSQGIKINNFSYGAITASNDKICIVSAGSLDSMTNMIENQKCRWIDYVQTGNSYTDPATGESINRFRLAFK